MSEFKDAKAAAAADDSDSDEEDNAKDVFKDVGEEEEAVAAPQEDTSLSNPDVVTKYQEAAKICQAALLEVIGQCVPGAKIVEICRFGDELIEQKCSNVYKNKNKAGKHVLKGVAFPVCISVNECVCHCSPLLSDDSLFEPLKADDMVKIDMGVHIDGYIVLVAHTLIVGLDYNDSATAEVICAPESQRSNVLNAAYVAAEVASKVIKPGVTNTEVTQVIKQVAELFGVNTISGTLMHSMKQFVLDGSKMILLKEEPEQKVETCTFEKGEVYAIDIAMTTGDGKPRELGNRTTVYKRAVENKYALKNKSSRAFFNDINKRFPTLPFSLRSMPDEKAAKMGVRECVTHQLLMPYPVLHERNGDFVAHVKFTVLLLPSGTLQISGLPPETYRAMCTLGKAPLDMPLIGANYGTILCEQLAAARSVTVPENLVEILARVKPENKKKAKKAAAKKAAATASA